ncbi:ATP-binding protein [Streptomyces sp. NPDC006012]|uniref:HAMP domain-containing sensor histidine kinase n=1 Tax=Streptomyces sp. NPDC006012 TaxID=3364739 RepID=UPI0036CCF46C
MSALSRLTVLRRPKLVSLRTTFAVSFAAITATVTILVGILSYSAAARLVRVDQQSVFTQVVQDVQTEVRQTEMVPQDFSSTRPGHDVVRPSRTDVQVLGAQGEIVDHGSPVLPVTAKDRAIATARAAGRTVQYTDVKVADDLFRVATVALGDGRGAVQVAQEFSDTEDLLRALQQRTLVLMAAVVIAAGLVGWWLARRITRRLVILTTAAEDVARTRRLGIQVPVAGLDEVGRLGRAFDRMLGRLAQSEEDQRRLVQDAGHELRTPLTSLRTNISLLRRIDELPPDTRDDLVADLTQEARELTDLVNELVDLAAGQSDTEPTQRVDIADVAEDVVGLARRRTGREIVLWTGGDTVTDGRPGMLQRALSNLLENATKFDSDRGSPIEVRVTGPALATARQFLRPYEGGAGTARMHARPAGPVRVEVLDRGPGIADGDLIRIFDRFYRAADARSLPGSGLGLSIVREVAMAHGGAPFALRRDGGGAVIGFTVGGGVTGDPDDGA